MKSLTFITCGLIMLILVLPTQPIVQADSPTPTVTTAATQAATKEVTMDPMTLFKYDEKAPLALKDIGTEKRGDVIIRDVTFTGATISDVIKANIVAPVGKGPFAGILYVHWLGDTNTTNRTEFLDEAVTLASEGTASVLIDAMWAQAGWYGARIPEKDYEASIRQVIDLRRALDVLLAQPGVDAKRIAYVGHDFGAMYGAVLAGVDPRPKTFVLMAGTTHFSKWFLYGPQPKSKADYLKQIAILDPTNYIHQLTTASVFLQFASIDQYVSAQDTADFYAAANPRKQMTTYDAHHDLGTKDVAADRVLWLERELGLSKSQ